jgi:Glycosyl hydrolase family 65, N-terminal domain
MITEQTFPVEPWQVRETKLDLNLLAQAESVFALSNGHIGLRGNLDEGEPYGLPGTYLNSFYETRPLPYAEAGYSYPEDGQSVVDVTNGKILRLLVDDEPFDVRYGHLESHERVLDLRAGTLTRQACWTSPAGETALDTAGVAGTAQCGGDRVRGRGGRRICPPHSAIRARRQRRSAAAVRRSPRRRVAVEPVGGRAARRG